MRVQRWYDPVRKEETFINRMHYKMNKCIVNALYPLLGEHSYGVDKTHDVIVSLTSYPARIATVHLTVRTLLNQTWRPGKVILWLAEDQFPDGRKTLPAKLLALEEVGLSIRFCENLYPHKKYYFAMRENPDSPVITVDDDVFYPEYLVEELLDTSARYPRTVCCTWAQKLIPDQNGSITCNDLHPEYDGTIPSYRILPTGVGGVLYPPGVLSDELFNRDAIRDCALMGDDLWLKTMALLAGTRAVRVAKPARIPFSAISTQHTGLYYENANHNRNQEMWEKLMKRYPACEDLLMNES